MELVELIQLLQRGERPQVEFKLDFPKQAHDIAREMVALANSGGGILLIGVDDEGKPRGVIDPGQAADRLAGIARSCSPPLLPEIDKVPLGNGRFVVYARIPHHPPSTYQGKFFVRVGATSVEASGGDELKNLLQYVGGIPSRPHEVPTLFIPPRVRGFKGRHAELGRLAALVDSESFSVIVVEGISGIGKTALAASFASTTVQRGYQRFWLDCREDTSFDVVTSALATFTRHHQNDFLADVLEDVTSRLEDRLARIAAVMADCKYILFLDDYHLVADPLMNRFLQKLGERASSLKICLICRKRPQLVTAVSPMLLAEQRIGNGLDPIATKEFLLACGVTVSENVAHRIWEVTGEGHPKALEIFIARSRNYPVEALLSSLPVFQDQLRNDWLAPLMNELRKEEKELAIDLSVFDRPIPLRALPLLYQGRDLSQPVVALADRFILDRVEEQLLQMHPLIREFCYELIPNKASRHQWAAAYYRCEAGLEVDRKLITNAQIESRIAAWSHLLKAGDYGEAVKELSTIRPSLMDRGQYEQVMFLLDHTPTRPETEQWFAIHRARILSLWGDFDGALSLLKPLLQSTDPRASREAILVLATVYNDHGKGGLAKKLLDAEHSRFTTKGLQRERVHPVQMRIVRRRFLCRLVEAHSLLGQLDQALQWASELIESCESEGDEIGGAVLLRHKAAVLRAQGKLDVALSLCEIGSQLLVKHQRIREAALTDLLAAAIHQELGDYQSALQRLTGALQVFVRMGDRKNSTICRQRIKQLQLDLEANPAEPRRRQSRVVVRRSAFEP